MSTPQKAFLVSTGEYSDYEVVVVCLDRAEAESLAEWLGNTGGYGTDAHEVEEVDLGDGWQTLDRFDELMVGAHIDEHGNVADDVERNNRGLGNRDKPACKVDITVDNYRGQHVIVRVHGTDHQRVRKVLSEQVAQAKADYAIIVEAHRLRREEQDRKYEQWKLDNPQGFLTTESSQSYYPGPAV